MPNSSQYELVPLGAGQPGVLETEDGIKTRLYCTVFVYFSVSVTCSDPSIEILSAKPPLIPVKTTLLKWNS